MPMGKVMSQSKKDHFWSQIDHLIAHGVPLDIAEELSEVGKIIVEGRDKAIAKIDKFGRQLQKKQIRTLDDALDEEVPEKMAEAFTDVSKVLLKTGKKVITRIENLDEKLQQILREMDPDPGPQKKSGTKGKNQTKGKKKKATKKKSQKKTSKIKKSTRKKASKK